MPNNRILFIIFLWVIHSQAIYALCVNSHRANLREGPGRTYQKTWQVYKNMPFRGVEKIGKWVKVRDVDGDFHWIHGTLVNKNSTCATIKVNQANLRTGPGKKFRKHKKMPLAEKYTSFKLLKIKGEWVLLQHEFGQKAWAHRRLLWVQ